MTPEGPLVLCAGMLVFGVIIAWGSIRLAHIELQKPEMLDGDACAGTTRYCPGAHRVLDPRVFDAYRATALFGGWVAFWSLLGVLDGVDVIPIVLEGVLFHDDAIFVGLLYWIGLEGSAATFLVYRRQEHYGRHPLQLAQKKQQRDRDAARA